MHTAHWLALLLVALGPLVAQARATPPHQVTRSARDKPVRDLDKINPDKWRSLWKVPAEVLNKAEFVVTGGYEGSQVLVHTVDRRTYVYTGFYGSGEKVELRGKRFQDAKMTTHFFDYNIFFVLLTDDGEVYTAGNNYRWQLGYETAGEKSPDFRKVPDLGTVIQTAAGDNHVLVLTQNKQVYFWGDMGTNPEKQRPRIVNFSQEGFIPAQVAAGRDHCIVLGEGGQSMMGWGWNGNNQLGLGEGAPTRISVDEPRGTQLPAGAQFQTIYAGLYTGFALDSQGRLWQWGYDGAGALGQGNRGTDHPAPTTDMPIMKTKKVVSLKVWQMSAVAITDENEVYIWGRYADGLKVYATLVPDASDTPLDVFADSYDPVTAGAARLAKARRG